jgi:hypothetical protein
LPALLTLASLSSHATGPQKLKIRRVCVYCKDFEKDRCNSSKMLLNEVVTMWQARPSL